jgi:hypothetical protein
MAIMAKGGAEDQTPETRAHSINVRYVGRFCDCLIEHNLQEE